MLETHRSAVAQHRRTADYPQTSVRSLSVEQKASEACLQGGTSIASSGEPRAVGSGSVEAKTGAERQGRGSGKRVKIGRKGDCYLFLILTTKTQLCKNIMHP